jgi:hypothetical protein
MCPTLLFYSTGLMESTATQWIKQVEDANKEPCNIQANF